MTFRMRPASCTVRATAAMSVSTYAQSPSFTLERFTTMSSSSAPSSMAMRVSATFAAVACVPCGNPITVQVATPEPRSRSAHSRTKNGQMQTLAQWLATA